MIRKFAIAVAAIAALGTASLTATTPASAGWKGGNHHHFHGGWGHGFRVYSAYGYDSCYRRYWGVNAFGEPVLRRVYVCG
jgi:hypothetical protein